MIYIINKLKFKLFFSILRTQINKGSSQVKSAKGFIVDVRYTLIAMVANSVSSFSVINCLYNNFTVIEYWAHMPAQPIGHSYYLDPNPGHADTHQSL